MRKKEGVHERVALEKGQTGVGGGHQGEGCEYASHSLGRHEDKHDEESGNANWILNHLKAQRGVEDMNTRFCRGFQRIGN